jgi:hypothetical protein
MKVDTGCIKNLAKHYFGGRLADRAAVRVPHLALAPPEMSVYQNPKNR